MRKRTYRHLGIIAVLFAVNFAVFFKHYLGNDMFPWDFWKSYYAMVSFWTTLARHGIIAEWVPFQYMGYPFFLNPQTGFFYPPFWLFALPGMHYSLHAAAIVQCLHVLWGAYGTYFLVRAVAGDWRSALFGALAYQFFGGFYCNSEHADIVRAYSWLPWLFWSATAGRRLLPRNYLLPIIVYCAISGSYPGNIGSHCFFLGIYLLAALFYAHASQWGFRDVCWLFVLGALGLLLSTVVVIPPLMMRHYLYHTSANLGTNNWPFQNWLSLMTPWATGNTIIKGFAGDPSMISAYISVPIVALIFLRTAKTIPRLQVWWLMLATSVVMALGQSSFFYTVISRIVPVLGMSRFPSSDYRGIVALAFIVLAAASFHEWLFSNSQCSAASRRRLAYLSLIPIAILNGIFGIALPKTELLWVTVIWTVTLALLYLLTTKVRLPPSIPAFALMLLVVVQGYHVVKTSSWTWTAGGTDLDDRYRQRIGLYTSSPNEPIIPRLRNVPTRPARETRKREDFSWAGYLLGSFQTGDYSNTELTAQYQITHDAMLIQFMKRPLTPVIFPNVTEVSRDALVLRLGQPESPVKNARNQIIPQVYALNSERYHVELSDNAVMVVNEIWFPGWEGRISHDRKTYTRITATNVDHAIRAWQLPAGNYTFVTHFKTPYLRVSAAISLLALIAYLSMTLTAILKSRLLKRSLSI